LTYISQLAGIVRDGGSRHFVNAFFDKYELLEKMSREKPMKGSDAATIREIVEAAEGELLPGFEKGAKRRFVWAK
jgi:hypothetical protein